jgi:hypothetical protein
LDGAKITMVLARQNSSQSVLSLLIFLSISDICSHIALQTHKSQ